MKVVVDYDLCEANALCMKAAPEVFRVEEDDTLTVLIDTVPAEFTKKVSAGINRRDKELANTRRLENPVSLDVILQVVAEANRIPVSKITGKRRPRGPVVQIRNMAMYLGQRYSQASLSVLAETFGLNHYTSVSSAIGKFRRQLSTDATMGDMVRVVEDRIETKRKT